MKSYPDIEQSKKLAEILPIKSADMYYIKGARLPCWIPSYVIDFFRLFDTGIPCWSLASLFNVLPNGNMLVKTIDGKYYCLAKDVMTKHYDNPIDACYEMILKLHELKVL